MAFVPCCASLRSNFRQNVLCHPRSGRLSPFRIRTTSRGLRMGLLDSLSSSINKALNRNATTDSTPSGSAVNTSPSLDGYFRRVQMINDMEPEIEGMTDSELKKEVSTIRSQVREGTPIDQVLERVFALVREATFRVLSLRHYDVQLVGGMVLHDATIAEMATGEGKTIVAALPAVLNAIDGMSVYIVTVNDYLARRDAELVGQVFRFCGFSVGLIQSQMSSEERRTAYSCDIVYVTNSELGFDYLRDNLALSSKDIVLSRPLDYCIIDEADSILIDEARTPLIISNREPANSQKYTVAKQAADALVTDVHYTVNEKEQSVILTEKGYVDLENALGVNDLFDPQNPWASFITNALKAKELFKDGVNYILGPDDENRMQVQIVDEFTGRILKGRRWSDGLHQAVEAKEGITVDSETVVAAKVSYQAFFKLFKKLSGMTGTATSDAAEFFEVYELDVIPVPTALPMARKDYPDVVFKNATGKYRGVMREIARAAPTGRPILIGTTSVEASETLSRLLTEVEVDHDVLNAKPESAFRESQIIAQAGRKFSITIATNMAGRGTDILLGGNADYFARALARRELASLSKPLAESLLNSEASILIDNNELPVDISENSMKNLSEAAVYLKSQVGSEQLTTLREVDALVTRAAENGPLEDNEKGLEALRDAVQDVKAELEDVITQEREEVLDLGGLLIIGTERSESRRVDNQLRGRAGRQGDPGGSRFFLSLDDTLFRVFGGDKVKNILETFRVDEDTPIENKIVNESLNNAQSNVEDYFRGIRRALLQYDEVLSTQRQAFYSKRRRVVVSEGEELEKIFVDDCLETAEEILGSVSDKKSSSDVEKLSSKLSQFFEGVTGVGPEQLRGASNTKKVVEERILQLFRNRKQELDDKKYGFSTEVLRFLWLTQMDNLWKEHMKTMDYLKEIVNLRVYGNEEPLQVFQEDGFKIFTDMLANIRRNNVYSYFKYNPTNVQKR